MTPQDTHILQRMYDDQHCVIVDRGKPPALYFYDPQVTYGETNQFCGADIERSQLDRLIAYGMVAPESEGSCIYRITEKGRVWIGL